MPGHTLQSSEALPRSHYFFTVSRGTGMRTVAVRAPLIQAALVLLPLLALVGVGSALYLAFHDDLVAELMRRQSAQQYAYEDRIETLRQEMDRQQDRARADQAEMDGRIHDLLAREARLEGRTAAVAALGAEKGGPATPPDLPVEITGRIPAPPAAALGYAATPKPRPLPEPAISGPAGAGRPEDHALLLDDVAIPVAARLAAAGRSLDRLEQAQSAALTRMNAAAGRRADRIRSLIEDAGLSPERYLARPAATALGGPFVPLPDRPDAGFDRAVAELRAKIAAATQLESALGRLPLAAPLLGRMEVTSPFGARTDPFLGRPALHTGVDLREGFGTDIRATAAGRVVFAGTAGGYGTMVEVDHGNGITTRYAHMGGVAVTEGQAVARGSILGVVGATGRATGPHLHYEVRVDGEPVDPTRFLAGAPRLASLASR